MDVFTGYGLFRLLWDMNHEAHEDVKWAFFPGVFGVKVNAESILARMEIGETGVLDSVLPRPLRQTPYAQYGNVVPAMILFLMILFSFRLKFRKL